MENLTKRQNEIIESSINLIAEAGIQNLTIKNLSKKIGITEPAIYRHYNCKMDILLGILAHFEENAQLMFKNIETANNSALEKIRTIFTKRCQEFANKPELAKVIFSEEIFQNDIQLTEKVASVMKLHQTNISKLVSEAQKAGEIRTDIPTDHLVLIIMGSLRLLVTKWRMSNFGFDIVNQAENQWQSIEKLIAKE